MEIINMNYIYMQLLILGLLVLIILIGQIYKIINDKYSTEKFVNYKNNQIEYWKRTIRYYNSLGDKALQDTIEEMEKDGTTDNFVRLDSNNILVESFVEGNTNGSDTVRRDTANDVETCRSLTKCDQLESYPNCGYCGTSGKFDYDGNGSDIKPSICLDSKVIASYVDGYTNSGTHAPNKQRGNQWAKSVHDCKKIKRQAICDNIKTCGDMTSGSESKNLCGWCPTDSRAKVKTSDNQVMYDGVGTDASSEIASDKCPDMGKAAPRDVDNIPLLTKLTTGTCSVCEEPVNGKAVGATGPHSDACLSSLWKASFTDVSGAYSVNCSTDFDDPKTADLKRYRNMKKSYHLVASDMKMDVKRPIATIMRKYEEDDGVHWNIRGVNGKYRRTQNIDEDVDKLWKQCFGENSRGNVDNNFGKDDK
jgi:hypothetical protein